MSVGEKDCGHNSLSTYFAGGHWFCVECDQIEQAKCKHAESFVHKGQFFCCSCRKLMTLAEIEVVDFKIALEAENFKISQSVADQFLKGLHDLSVPIEGDLGLASRADSNEQAKYPYYVEINGREYNLIQSAHTYALLKEYEDLLRCINDFLEEFKGDGVSVKTAMKLSDVLGAIRVRQEWRPM